MAKGLALLHSWEPKPIIHGDIKCVSIVVVYLIIILIVSKENILIGSNMLPLITDFGLSKVCFKNFRGRGGDTDVVEKILEDVTGTPFTQSKGISDSYRWFAPEICSAPGVLSPQSDMFSFAMTVIEVNCAALYWKMFADRPQMITCEAPYAEVRRTTEVLFNMQKGLRPARPLGTKYVERGLTDHVWKLVNMAWQQDPKDRLSSQRFLEMMDM